MKTQENGLMSFLGNVLSFIVEKAKAFFDDFIMAPIKKIESYISQVVGKIKNVFVSNSTGKLFKLMYCIYDSNYLAFWLKIRFNLMLKTINQLIEGIATAVTGLGVFLILDVLFTLLCEYRRYLLAVNYISLGFKYLKGNDEEKKVAWTYFGLGAGSIFWALGEPTILTRVKGLINVTDKIKLPSSTTKVN